MALDIFGNLFGGNTTTGINALLSADQRRLMNQQGNLSAAAALLQAGGRSRQRVGLGQALGAALQAGQQGYQQARTGSLQELLLGEKLREGQDERKRNTDFFAMLRDAGQPAAAMPAPMPPAPGMAMPGPTEFPVASMEVGTSDALRGGPIPEARMISQPMAPAAAPLSSAQSALIAPRPGTAQPRAAGGAPQTMQEFLQQQPPAYLQSLAGMSRSEAMKSIQERMTQSMKFGKPEFFMRGDELVAQRFNELGDMQEVPGLAPRDAPPSSIAEYRLAVAQGDKRSFSQFDLDRRQSSASRQTVNVGPGGKDLTPGQKKVDELFGQTYVDWQTGGGSDMIGGMAAIGSVLAELEAGKPLTGPMIGIQPDFIRAIVSPNATDALERVQEVVQRNLRIVLGSAFTAQEGTQLINRAYNPTLPPAQNAARLRKLFQQMSISAKQRQGMVDFFEENGTLQGYRGPRPNINDFYKALEGGANSTQRKPLTDIFGGPR